MLKLIRALDMPFASVENYFNSFKALRKKWLYEINCSAISTIIKGKDSYFKSITSDPDDILYYLVDDKRPDYIIGFGRIDNSPIFDWDKNYLNEGNISYGVRPAERKKGYGALILKMLLEKSEELGLSEVCVSCLEENIASKKIIEKNNGIFEKRWLDDQTEKDALKYWIKLTPSKSTKLTRSKNPNNIKTIS